MKEATVRDSKVREAAVVNPIDAFSFVLDKRMNDVIVDRVDQNEAMAAKFLNDPAFKKVTMDVLTKQVWEKIRKEEGVEVSQKERNTGRSRCMPIPDYQAFMLPLLRYASDGKEHKKSDAVRTFQPDNGRPRSLASPPFRE